MAESLDGNHAASDEYRRSFQNPRMSDSLGMACDYYYDPFCEVCAETKNRNIKHEGFCNDCVQFLCEDCLRVHRKLQAARGHVIRRGDDMPKSMADKPPKFDSCNIHQNSKKDQFCGAHRVVLCSLCVPLHHRGCPVTSVYDACKGLSSPEKDALYDKVKDFKTTLSLAVAQIDRNITELGNQKVNLMKDALDMKDKAIEKIEKLFKELTSETELLYKTHTLDLDQSKRKLNDTIVNLEGSLDEISKVAGSNVDTKVFLKIQDIVKDVEQCTVDVESLKPSAANVKMSFIKDKWMREFFLTDFKIGSISIDTSKSHVAISVPKILFPVSATSPIPVSKGRGTRTPTRVSGQVAGKIASLPQMKVQKLPSLNVKLANDMSGCCIHGLAITYDGRRLLADCDNSKIKLFSRDTKSLCSLAMPCAPWNIAVIRDREAVVSCGKAKLLILNISDKNMSIKGTVSLPFAVVGIAPYKDKLLVTSYTSPRGVKLIDLSGRVYWSTDTGQQGQRLFICPDYVTCYDDGGSAAVIVSDQSNNTLTVLNADTGDVINSRAVKGKSPKGVTTDTVGNFYVCYYNTDEVAVLSRDLSQERIMLSMNDGLSRGPQAINYNAVDHQLLVSYVSNTVDCFRLS